MTCPRVSVLMAVYNAESYLQKALDSLLCGQTYTDIEVVAVDDCSTDGSFAILSERAQTDSRLCVLQQSPNQGQAVARNLALQKAQGEFVMSVDADDWLSADAIQSAVRRFAEVPDADCVVLRLLQHWERDGREEFYPEPLPLTEVLDGERAFQLSLTWQLHGLYMVRRSLHQQYPYDTSFRLYSDDNTCRIHYLRSRKVAFCEGIYYYRKHEESCTSAISPRRFLHLEANLSMLSTLRREQVGDDIITMYDEVRWQNYVGLVRFYDWHAASFPKDERERIAKRLRQVYDTFAKSLPYPLFRFRQWAGAQYKKHTT
ncbi:MAG: glycosyltransferase family 2 protein [Bacteroidaceae bacterium]|nr:glycosyltransferase family 2 protein [Bacteroidaceae bacterium]